MEPLFFIICSSFFAYAVQKLERLELKIDSIENDIVLLKMNSPKRKSDIHYEQNID